MSIIFFLTGLASWAIVEYLMHRFVLHGWASSLHNAHHENPTDISDLFIDWRMVAVVSLVFCGMLLPFFDGLSVMLMYCGVVTGYFIYEFVHYNVHHCRPRNKIMKHLRKHHLRHHHMHEKGNYSVVFPSLDWLCGTKV